MTQQISSLRRYNHFGTLPCKTESTAIEADTLRYVTCSRRTLHPVDLLSINDSRGTRTHRYHRERVVSLPLDYGARIAEKGLEPLTSWL